MMNWWLSHQPLVMIFSALYNHFLGCSETSVLESDLFIYLFITNFHLSVCFIEDMCQQSPPKLLNVRAATAIWYNSGWKIFRQLVRWAPNLNIIITQPLSPSLMQVSISRSPIYLFFHKPLKDHHRQKVLV